MVSQIGKLFDPNGFAAPLSPHHGGLHEAAVKSVKHHLKRCIGTTNLTVGELFTLIAQVKACVNSRPISPLTDDPNDLTALTPGHFLVGENLITLVEPRPLIDVQPSSLTRWERTQQNYQHIWERWHGEYLTELRKRTKWTTVHENLQPNDMVLVKDDSSPPSVWPLARVIETFPAGDGLVRVVKIRTMNGEYTRPITKLAILPTDEQTINQTQN